SLVVEQTGWNAVPLAAIGFGQGLALPLLIRLSVSHIPRRYAGLASGLVNATLQISAAISVAIVGTVYYAIAERHGQSPAIAADPVTTGSKYFAVGTETLAPGLRIPSTTITWKRSSSSSLDRPTPLSATR